MGFDIRGMETEEDLAYFVATEFLTEKENGMIPPGRSEKEARREHRKELLEFVEGKPKRAILIAETGEGEYAGLIWVSVSEVRELWDFETAPAWVYDIRVEPEFRRQGLGKTLLQQAEGWARKEGFAKIGLHAFGTNEAAVGLYRSTGYAVKNCYLQKDLVSQGGIAPSGISLRIRERRNGADTAHFLTLAYQRFKADALSGGDVPEQALRERFDAFAEKADYDQPNHRVFVAEDPAGTFAGYSWVYISQGDLGSEKYVWMQGLEASPAYCGEGVLKQLLAQAGAWTLEQGLGAVRTGVHAQDLFKLRLLRTAGYVETNYYMEKRVDGLCE